MGIVYRRTNAERRNDFILFFRYFFITPTNIVVYIWDGIFMCCVQVFSYPGKVELAVVDV